MLVTEILIAHIETHHGTCSGEATGGDMEGEQDGVYRNVCGGNGGLELLGRGSKSLFAMPY